MAQQPFSSGILGLVRNTGAFDTPSLLRQATELFVGESWHPKNEIAMFVELSAQLLRVTDLTDRIEIARLLAAYPATPRSVARMLMQDIFPVASQFIETAADIDETELLALIAKAPASHLELVAGRRTLSPVVVEALLTKMPPGSLPVLLANPVLRLPPSSIDHLVDLGRDDPAIASALAARLDDVQDTDLIELFLVLDGRGRRRVIQALEIAALREFAARRPQPKVPLPDQEKIATLAKACLSHDTGVMAEILGAILELPTDLAETLLTDAGGEPLAIALKASGIGSAVATRVFLFSGNTDTRTYFEVKRLIDLYESVSLRSAVLLADRWRGRRPAAIPAHGKYQPQTQESVPARSRDVARPQPRPEVRPAAGTGRQSA